MYRCIRDDGVVGAPDLELSGDAVHRYTRGECQQECTSNLACTVYVFREQASALSHPFNVVNGG